MSRVPAQNVVASDLPVSADSRDKPGVRDRIDVLQLLRGLAAVMVVMFHASIYQVQSDSNAFSKWLVASGPSGVDLFFCISGFVMVITTRSARNRHVLDFVIKRITRIVPSYAILTLVYIAVMRLVMHLIRFQDPNYHFDLRSICRSLLFIPLRLGTPTEAPLWGTATLHVGWTLNYEMYFYLIFAMSLLFGRARWMVFFSWMAATLILLPLIMRGHVAIDAYAFYGFRPPYLNLATSPLIWEFVAGCVIGLLYLSRLQFPNRQTAWLSVLVTGSFAVWLLLNGFNPGFGPPRWGFIHMLLFLVVMIADKTLHFRVPRSLIWLGNASFSIYLVHPIVVDAIGVTLVLGHHMDALLTGLPYIFFLTSLSIAIAAVPHLWIEDRLSNRLRLALLRSAFSDDRSQNGLPTGGSSPRRVGRQVG